MKTPAELLAWLASEHPAVEAEQDRHWVWVSTNLKDQPAVRESLKAQGFRFARNGHTLPSGKMGTWGHHCDAPTPYRRKGSKQASTSTKNEPQRADPLAGAPRELSDEEAMNALLV